MNEARPQIESVKTSNFLRERKVITTAEELIKILPEIIEEDHRRVPIRPLPQNQYISSQPY